jgi:CBS domain-containing protein
MSLAESPLSRIRVKDIMHTGLLTTDPGTSLRVVARLMAERRVHAVTVADPDYARLPWKVLTDLDVAAAAAEETDESAGEAARGEVVTISDEERLSEAARRMVEHGVSHLVVVDPRSGHPSGIISTLDVAAAYAG